MNVVTNDITFSVIIAVYNGEDTLARAIDSILAQTQKTHEIIVVDDGSVDKTADVVKAYGDRVRYFYQENSGVSAARNYGAKQAKADWLAFLDADDWYYPKRIELHREWIKKDKQLDFLTGNFDYVTPEGALIKKSMENTPTGKHLLALSDELHVVMSGEVIGQFISEHFGDTHTLSVPRKTFLALGGYPSGYAVCEDVNFLIRLCAMSQRIGVIKTPMAAYAIFENSATRSNPLRAQKQTLSALQSLRSELLGSPAYLKAGLEEGIRHARRDLAYVFLKNKEKTNAIKAVFPLVWENPGWQSVRDVLSIIRG